MDIVFIEEIKDEKYRIAAINKDRIYSSENPGNLASVFECPVKNRSVDDDAQIFYALAPSIDAINILIDLNEKHKTQKLNTWSVITRDINSSNIFDAVRLLEHDDRLKLYDQKWSITQEKTITSTSKSLFSFVAFSEAQSWKTGILQRCIDCLVLPEYRENKEVYSIIDEKYRQIMRFKFETEDNDGKIAELCNLQQCKVLIKSIKHILKLLGLKNTHDTTMFSSIPPEVDRYLDLILYVLLKNERKNTDTLDRLSYLFTIWSGSSISKCENGYKIQPEQSILKALNYMQPLLQYPDTLHIINDPL